MFVVFLWAQQVVPLSPRSLCRLHSQCPEDPVRKGLWSH